MYELLLNFTVVSCVYMSSYEVDLKKKFIIRYMNRENHNRPDLALPSGSSMNRV